jgi:Ser/Thr protein kinase RdoA (MazF antagonist)
MPHSSVARHKLIRPDVYAFLTPERVLDALESVGLRGDGRLLQLNSYENRVFQLFLEDGTAVVAKFYRPWRWTDAQILEEHAFALELVGDEVPVAQPIALPSGTLARVTFDEVDYRFSVSERRAGRAPELEQLDTLNRLGRFIGRLHAVGRRSSFQHRRRLDVSTFGQLPRDAILNAEVIPADQQVEWRSQCDAALDRVIGAIANASPINQIRLHGDCHPGNVLWREEEGPHFVDLDDACMGPAVHDLWMLVSGDESTTHTQFEALLTGYRMFSDFDVRELKLVEALRTLRMIHHSAWIAARWGDPAFPTAFPWFGTAAYWSEQTTQLREQCIEMDIAEVRK